jgi:hypothetical protein
MPEDPTAVIIMAQKCPYVKRDGSLCGLGFKKPHSLCAKHRIQPPAKASGPCKGCGLTTARKSMEDPEVYFCPRLGCGRNEYRRDLARRKREGPAPVDDAPAAWQALATEDRAEIVKYILRGGYAIEARHDQA